MTDDAAAPRVRVAGLADSQGIADLHARSWRLNYRGAFTDAYLDGPIVAERRRVWNDRLAEPAPGQAVILAEQAGSVVGFVCSFADHHRTWGSLIDNLHVAEANKGRGLGRSLMRETARKLVDLAPYRPVYLHVIEANHAARHFYDRLGGHPADHSRITEPGGSFCRVVRYVWTSPAHLFESTAKSCASGLAGRRRAGMQHPDQG